MQVYVKKKKRKSQANVLLASLSAKALTEPVSNWEENDELETKMVVDMALKNKPVKVAP